MADDKSPIDDELAGTEQPFVQHLIELRDRLLYSAYGIGAIFALLVFYPGPSALYDLLAMPLVKTLPAGSHMIAVGVVSPFLVPIKVSVLAAFGVALPWVLYRRAFTSTNDAWSFHWLWPVPCCFTRARLFAISLCLAKPFQLFKKWRQPLWR